MLRWRLPLSVLIIAALVALCWVDGHQATPGLWLLPLAVVLALAGTHELLGLWEGQQYRPSGWAVYPANLIIVLSNWAPLLHSPQQLGYGRNHWSWPAAALALSVLGAFGCEMYHYQAPGRSTARLGGATLAMAYVGLLASFVLQLRLWAAGMHGIVALAALIIVVKMGDTGAYTVGRLIGRHKLVPTLSPGKTIEGALGGLAFAAFGGWLAFFWLMPLARPSATHVDAWRSVLFGVIVGAAGMAGDLAESLLKRDVGKKDSSTWMPGFGGLLDLLDSILFAGPVAYCLFAWGLVWV